MHIVDKKLVVSIDWNNDQALSQLCRDQDYFLVVNPELDESILDLITTDIPLNDYCVKYKIGQGWIAKRFSRQWNGQLQIIQLPITPYNITADKYANVNNKILKYDVPAWDLVYKHIWTYDTALTGGAEVNAVVVSYIKSANHHKFIGVADVKPIDNDFDVIFLTYDETGTDVNWQRLRSIVPRAKKLIGIKGIYKAHARAAEIAQTDMFYVVDADAYIEDFEFDYVPLIQDRNKVHIWYSRNPVNGLEYGYGGVKLFAKSQFEHIITGSIDVSTSVGEVKVVPEIACETRFNTDEFSTWRSAFRECAKLGSRLIKNQVHRETEERLRVWTSVNNGAAYGEYCIAGAKAGAEYGKNNIDNPYALEKINDYAWLMEQFNKVQI